MPVENVLGSIALLGSGETSLAGGRIFETIARRLPGTLRIAILETPAGFELNSSAVVERIADFLKTRLHNYNPKVVLIPARKRGTPFDPEDPRILQPLLESTLIFMGPGSPTYAVRQLKGSLAWDLIRARHRQGAALVLASAAVIAAGAYTLPVYEIYKVGEDVRYVHGLDLFADFNLQLSLIPHWNNADGGDELDTSRCFIGTERFTQWCDQLPPGHTTIGLDEHTGIIYDFADRKCSVSGVSSVTLLRARNPVIFPAGAAFPIRELGEFRMPDNPGAGISARAWEMVKYGAQIKEFEEVPAEIDKLVEKREQARLNQEWEEADMLRQQIAALGWIIQDTMDGQKIVRHS
jgi:hypothetical protein